MVPVRGRAHSHEGSSRAAPEERLRGPRHQGDFLAPISQIAAPVAKKEYVARGRVYVVLNHMEPDVARIFASEENAERWLDEVAVRRSWYRIHPWDFDDPEVS